MRQLSCTGAVASVLLWVWQISCHLGGDPIQVVDSDGHLGEVLSLGARQGHARVEVKLAKGVLTPWIYART